jgi:hypothetical protein
MESFGFCGDLPGFVVGFSYLSGFLGICFGVYLQLGRPILRAKRGEVVVSCWFFVARNVVEWKVMGRLASGGFATSVRLLANLPKTRLCGHEGMCV